MASPPPPPPSLETAKQYSHSPIHLAILSGDHAALRCILEALPPPAAAGSIQTEEESVVAEELAVRASAVLDCRDVPLKESPLCLAVRLRDALAVDMLMAAGADLNLQNAGGWTPLQEAVCLRDEVLTSIILRRYQVLTWAKYMRRLPALSAIMKRMRNFYMELTWSFESSVIPFIARIAPSDTYRIWKKGSCLRADMTLAGFDGLRIKRKNQSLVFFGDGSEIGDRKVRPGTIIMLNHEKKESFDALEGAGVEPTEAEIASDVKSFFQTNVYRAGIDVSGALVVPQTSWRGHARTESVGGYRSRIYEMQNVQLKFKSRQVPGAMTDDELFGGKEEEGGGRSRGRAGGRSTEGSNGRAHEVGLLEKEEGREGEDAEDENDSSQMELEDILTEDERRQLEDALAEGKEYEEGGGREVNGEERGSLDDSMRRLRVGEDRGEGCSSPDVRSKGGTGFKSSPSVGPTVGKVFSGEMGLGEDSEGRGREHGLKREGWFGGRQPMREGVGEKDYKAEKEEYRAKGRRYRMSWGGTERSEETGGVGVEKEWEGGEGKRAREEERRNLRGAGRQEGDGEDKGRGKAKKRSTDGFEKKEENEFKKGLKPMLWLTEEFPLDMKELMPLLDLLANRVKAVRRVKELLMTKLPAGMVPVKVAIPIIPTIRVSVTFSCFEEFFPPAKESREEGEEEGEEFHTPTGSPERESDTNKRGSWLSWVRGKSRNESPGKGEEVVGGEVEEVDHPNRWAEDPFKVPEDYRWIDLHERKKREREKRRKARAKAKSKAGGVKKKESSGSSSGAVTKGEEKGELI